MAGNKRGNRAYRGPRGKGKRNRNRDNEEHTTVTAGPAGLAAAAVAVAAIGSMDALASNTNTVDEESANTASEIQAEQLSRLTITEDEDMVIVTIGAEVHPHKLDNLTTKIKHADTISAEVAPKMNAPKQVNSTVTTNHTTDATAKSATGMKGPHLVLLKTKAETRSQTELLQVWTVEVPVKASNSVLIAVKDIPGHDSVDIQHLRRVTRPDALPAHLLSSPPPLPLPVPSQTSKKTKKRSRPSTSGSNKSNGKTKTFAELGWTASDIDAWTPSWTPNDTKSWTDNNEWTLAETQSTLTESGESTIDSSGWKSSLTEFGPSTSHSNGMAQSTLTDIRPSTGDSSTSDGMTKAASSDSRPSSSNSNKSFSSSNSKYKPRRARSTRSTRSQKLQNNANSTVHIVIGPTSLISLEDLTKLLARLPVFAQDGFPLKIVKVTVPMFAPSSPEHAVQWSKSHWPTMYRKTNPFGPHPHLVIRSEEELMADDSPAKYMAMAAQAAREATEHGLGEGTGCVIVERRDGEARVLAVAGDARRCGMVNSSAEDTTVAGNVLGHSLLRAVSMVAKKRVRVANPKSKRTKGDVFPGEDTPSDEMSPTDETATPDESLPSGEESPMAEDLLSDEAFPQEDPVSDETSIKGSEKMPSSPVSHVKDCPESVSSVFLDYPLTTTEKYAFDKTEMVPDGYLCVHLEIYLTHEPCLMCSMSIVHSRFGRCIFRQHMPNSGGLVAEDGLGYGMFWRPELNWKLLCWQWKDEAEEKKLLLSGDTQV